MDNMLVIDSDDLVDCINQCQDINKKKLTGND